jgi:glutaredoxin
MHVLLLTQEHCAFCTQARAILDRLSAEYGFTLSTLDISTSAGEALAMQHGILFPPGIFLDGAPFSYGRLSERKLRKELERQRKFGEVQPPSPQEGKP